MPSLVTFPASAPHDEMMDVLNRDGAIIIKDLVSPVEADAVMTELRPYIDATKPGQDPFSGFKTTRTGAIVARSPKARGLILNPIVNKFCESVLKPNCERYQLHLGQVIRILPGQEAQPIHRDRWAWGTYLKGIEPQLNTIWALSDFTKENGATQVVPGSVTWPDDRRPTDDEITWAAMTRGSAIIYTGTVFHGGGANVSKVERVGLNITYTLGWLRQEENQYLACPPDIARTLSPELQALIGYSMGSYALGYYTPPLPPGEGPEVVPPEFALNGAAAGSALGNAELLKSIAQQVGDSTLAKELSAG